MKTDIIRIDNQGDGFTEAVDMVDRTAAYARLENKSALQLSLLAQEMLCLARSITGDLQADFWIELTDGQFNLHMSTKTLMDADKRSMLIEAASSRKNEAAKGLLGILRDKVEQALVVPVNHSQDEVPFELMSDVGNRVCEEPEWDGFERSVLLKLADNVKIAIRGDKVDIIVSKHFK
jgi:hypothetical protein